MNELSEELIQLWLRMSGVIRNNRLITTMTFNEIYVCNLLYRQKQTHAPLLTATDLGNHMKLLKSQMNKIISSLEDKGILLRIRSDEDKRKIYLTLSEENLNVYLSEHQRILTMLNQLIEEIGEESMQQLIQLLDKVTDVMETFC